MLHQTETVVNDSAQPVLDSAWKRTFSAVKFKSTAWSAHLYLVNINGKDGSVCVWLVHGHFVLLRISGWCAFKLVPSNWLRIGFDEGHTLMHASAKILLGERSWLDLLSVMEGAVPHIFDVYLFMPSNTEVV